LTLGALTFVIALVVIIVAASTDSSAIVAAIVGGLIIFTVAIVGSLKMRAALKRDFEKLPPKGELPE
jgi:uncharacterized protein (DUF58 family)